MVGSAFTLRAMLSTVMMGAKQLPGNFIAVTKTNKFARKTAACIWEISVDRQHSNRTTARYVIIMRSLVSSCFSFAAHVSGGTSGTDRVAARPVVPIFKDFY